MLGVEGCCQGPRPPRPDAAYLPPGGFIGIDNCCERTEAAKQRSRGRTGHTGCARQGHLCRPRPESSFRPLRIRRPIFGRCAASAVREARKPMRRVRRVLGAEQRDPEICQCETSAANCRRREWTVVEMLPFDEEVGKSRRSSESSELWPEGASDDRQMEAAHSLALDERAASYVVVTVGKALDLDVDAVNGEMRRNPTRFLANIGNDPHHGRTMSQKSSGKSAKPVPTSTALACSRSERA